jgi:hypothetical protein
MLAVKRAILAKLQLFLRITPVFAGGIVLPLTFTALQRYQFRRRFL